jgi:diaminopimelate decarboxylase
MIAYYGPPTPAALQVKSAFGARYFGLDACMAHLMRPGMYGAYHAISVPARESDKQCVSAHVVGTLCENNDWFAKVLFDTLSPRLRCLARILRPGCSAVATLPASPRRHES